MIEKAREYYKEWFKGKTVSTVTGEKMIHYCMTDFSNQQTKPLEERIQTLEEENLKLSSGTLSGLLKEENIKLREVLKTWLPTFEDSLNTHEKYDIEQLLKP